MNPSVNHEQRLEREAAFHDEWAAGIDPATTLVDETFTVPTAVENQYILHNLNPGDAPHQPFPS
jgi:hypothetical protein